MLYQYTDNIAIYKIGEIKYIANDCTNITCTDELISPNAPLIPGSLTSTEAKHTTVGGPDWSQKYNNEHPFREHSGIDAGEWAYRGQTLGAGEIMLTSVDREGTAGGFDLDLVKAVSERRIANFLGR